MIVEEIKNIKSTKKELRQFGIVMGVVCGLLGALFLWRQKDYYPYLFAISALFLSLGFVLPIILKPIQKVWMSIAVLMNFVMTRVILSILFYLIVTPIGLLAKLFGKQFLDLKIDKRKKSYWNYRKSVEFSQSNYEKQF
ncbi:MAG: SxtJ family membrane protein [Candidatus Gygaella obscura]|nr:SxtJ family membrane protein [Candidatus Gygaella obscura]